MTGEISLHGAVLPVGGVAEKVRAARKVGISRVVVPEANQRGQRGLAGRRQRRKG